MKSFKNYTLNEEVNLGAYVVSGKLDVDDPAVRDSINTFLNGATGRCFLTPYIAYERVSKVLANFHIHLPRTTFLENDSGMVVLPVSQFGGKFGMQNDGQVYTKNDSDYHVYFEYRMNDKGLYDVFCEILDGTELEDIMNDLHSELEDDSDDDDETEEVSTASDMRDEKLEPKKMYEESRPVEMAKNVPSSYYSIGSKTPSGVTAKGPDPFKNKPSSGMPSRPNNVQNMRTDQKSSTPPAELKLPSGPHLNNKYKVEPLGPSGPHLNNRYEVRNLEEAKEAACACLHGKKKV